MLLGRRSSPQSWAHPRDHNNDCPRHWGLGTEAEEWEVDSAEAVAAEVVAAEVVAALQPG
jgi:hypothetical protein